MHAIQDQNELKSVKDELQAYTHGVKIKDVMAKVRKRQETVVRDIIFRVWRHHAMVVALKRHRMELKKLQRWFTMWRLHRQIEEGTIVIDDDDGEEAGKEATILMGMGGEAGDMDVDVDVVDVDALEEDVDAGPGFVIKEVEPAPPPEPPKAPSPVPEAIPLSSQEMFGGTGGDPVAPPEIEATMTEANTQTDMSAKPNEVRYFFYVNDFSEGYINRALG